MKARIMNYRGSQKEQNNRHMILQVSGIHSKKDAEKVIGKKVTWTSPSGKKISGVISHAHGSKGYVRAIFADKGLPGQALGTEADVE